MFEHISKPVIPRAQFISRQMLALWLGFAMIVGSLAIGMMGYHYFFPKLDWADAFVNAAMILSGMGPIAIPESTGAKIFSGCYAIYSGLMLVMSAGVIFAPLVHRFLHKLHADESDFRERKAREQKTKP
ncbi:MAG: hypothetical protein H7232_03555 [Aeromicrobium sp.]|nr:hypothetical protein [Burkholderiales bacterium]